MIANNHEALLQAVRTFITRMCSRQSVTWCEGEAGPQDTMAGPAVTRHTSDRPGLHMQNSWYNDEGTDCTIEGSRFYSRIRKETFSLP